MRRIIAVLLALAVLLLAGCCIIDSQTKTLIGETAILSKQVADNAQAQADVPAGLKAYLLENSAQWAYFDDLAHGRKAGGP